MAEKGAVITPPINKPATIFHWLKPPANIKVNALANVSTNFAKLELPMT